MNSKGLPEQLSEKEWRSTAAAFYAVDRAQAAHGLYVDRRRVTARDPDNEAGKLAVTLATRSTIENRTIEDDELRELWIKAGGTFHGSSVDSFRMPAELLFPLLRLLLTI